MAEEARKVIYKPGETCLCSGQYIIVDAKGKPIGPERTVVLEARFPPTPKPGQGYLLIDPTQHSTFTSTQGPPRKHSRQVYFLLLYYSMILVFSFWLLFDTWSSNFTFMRLIGVSGEVLEDPLLRTIGFTLVGGITGNVLYSIRQLFKYYAKLKTYDPRWLGKYITGPWEGAGMAMIVLALIRGGVSVFGGSMVTEVNGASDFAAFSTAALVGFGMREVVRWLDGLVKTMFTTHGKESTGSMVEEPGSEDGSAKDGEAETED